MEQQERTFITAGMQNGPAAWEDRGGFLPSQILLSPYDPAITRLSIYPKELQTCPHGTL